MVWGLRVLTGKLRGDPLEHNGDFGVVGLNWQGVYAGSSVGAAFLGVVLGSRVSDRRSWAWAAWMMVWEVLVFVAPVLGKTGPITKRARRQGHER